MIKTWGSRRWAAVGAALLVCAGCGGAGVAGGAPAPKNTLPAASSATPPGSTGPTVDPAIAHWAKAWKRKIARPMRRATTTLAANLGPAVAGSSTAAFRLTPALNALTNCRNPLDLGLAQAPPELAKARRRTLAACRAIYLATDGVVAGLNAQSTSAAAAGLARVRKGVQRLRRIERELKQAATPR